MSRVEHINPKLLTWARETAGFTVPEAALKLGLKDGATATAEAKLAAIEASGQIARSVLQKAATVFRRPLIAFYLPDIPRRGERGEDFRAPAPGAVSTKEEGMLDALVRDIRARQQIVRDILEDENEVVRLAFVSSMPHDSDSAAISDAIRRSIGVEVEAQLHAASAERLFTKLRAATEQAGVYVLTLGDLGSPQSDISEQVFRGFALADAVAPFVVVNDNDAAAGRSFTLIHELAHVILGASGVSGPLRRPSQNPIERLCNDAASHFLLPTGALDAVAQDAKAADIAGIHKLSASIASRWNVSQAVVVYRFRRNDWIADETARVVFTDLFHRWRASRDRAKQELTSGTTGPGYYLLRRSMVGPRLLDLTRRALRGGTITRTTAAKVLGVRPTGVENMLNIPERVRRT